MISNILQGALVRLRALEPRDIDMLYDWENRSEFWDVSMVQQPFSKHVLSQYLDNQHIDVFQSGQLRLVIENEKGPIGTVELFDVDVHHSRAGVGVMIVEKEDRSKGYATEALQLLQNYSFQHLQLHQLYCNIAVDNEGSIALFEKLGYQRIGLKKDWVKVNQVYLDICLYQLIAG